MFNYTYCHKTFVPRDRLKMYEDTHEKNPEKKSGTRKYSAVMQVSYGINDAFNHLKSALGGVFQT